MNPVPMRPDTGLGSHDNCREDLPPPSSAWMIGCLADDLFMFHLATATTTTLALPLFHSIVYMHFEKKEYYQNVMWPPTQKGVVAYRKDQNGVPTSAAPAPALRGPLLLARLRHRAVRGLAPSKGLLIRRLCLFKLGGDAGVHLGADRDQHRRPLVPRGPLQLLRVADVGNACGDGHLIGPE